MTILISKEATNKINWAGCTLHLLQKVMHPSKSSRPLSIIMTVRQPYIRRKAMKHI